MKKGDRVLIVGSHPHAGQTAEVIGFEMLKILGIVGMKCKADNGDEFFVTEPRQCKLIAAENTSRRRVSRLRHVSHL